MRNRFPAGKAREKGSRAKKKNKPEVLKALVLRGRACSTSHRRWRQSLAPGVSPGSRDHTLPLSPVRGRQKPFRLAKIRKYLPPLAELNPSIAVSTPGLRPGLHSAAH